MVRVEVSGIVVLLVRLHDVARYKADIVVTLSLPVGDRAFDSLAFKVLAIAEAYGDVLVIQYNDRLLFVPAVVRFGIQLGCL